MTKSEKTEKVKKDLRRLRKLTHSIDVLLRVEEMHGLRISYLERNATTNGNVRKAERIRNALSSLRISESIEEATALEELYIGAISKLEPIDRTIILESYINGKTYRNIGEDIGYTEAGVQKRVNRIIETIATLI